MDEVIKRSMESINNQFPTNECQELIKFAEREAERIEG